MLLQVFITSLDNLNEANGDIRSILWRSNPEPFVIFKSLQ
jgi:hypothetical protein